jgi:hypothetical protein
VRRSLLVALVVAGALALAGGGTALALAGGNGSPAQTGATRSGDTLQVAADYLGISAASLRDQLAAGKTLAEIANATSGKSADGLIQALLAAAKQRITALVDGKLPFAPLGSGPRLAFPLPMLGLDTAASYLGLSTSSLLDQLRSGKSLADIANATSGKSASGLVTALVNAAKAKLGAAVASGRLTQAQADEIQSHLQQAITDLVNRTPHLGGFGFRLRDGGPGLPFLGPGRHA